MNLLGEVAMVFGIILLLGVTPAAYLILPALAYLALVDALFGNDEGSGAILLFPVGFFGYVIVVAIFGWWSVIPFILLFAIGLRWSDTRSAQRERRRLMALDRCSEAEALALRLGIFRDESVVSRARSDFRVSHRRKNEQTPTEGRSNHLDMLWANHLHRLINAVKEANANARGRDD